jgi:hypothetical protein
MRRNRSSLLITAALCLILGSLPALAIESRTGITEALRVEGEEALADGRLAAAVEAFEEALAWHLADGDAALVGDRLADLGRVHEAAGRTGTALSYYRTALAFHLEAADRIGVTADLVAMARTAGALGFDDAARRHRETSLAVAAGMALDGLAAVADPLSCGGTNEIDPDPEDIGNETNTWTTFGYGATVEEAAADALGGLFAQMYGLPDCETTCPDGSAPAADECQPNILPSRPVSTDPGDYGDDETEEWKKRKRGGKWVVGPITISAFPDGLKAVQSCTACDDDEEEETETPMEVTP